MATLRVSEEEAVRRGWIPAPPVKPTEQKIKYVRVAVPETVKVYHARGFDLARVLEFIAAWFLGFFMAMVFIK